MTERPHVERRHPPDALMRVVNPVVRLLLDSPLHRSVSSQVLLLQYRGRRTGREITLPVGCHRLADGTLALFTNSRWRLNFRGGCDAEVMLRGERVPVRGTLIEDPDAVATEYQRIIDEIGWKAAQRRLGLRINVGRAPSRDELWQAIIDSGLSIVRLDPVVVSDEAPDRLGAGRQSRHSHRLLEHAAAQAARRAIPAGSPAHRARRLSSRLGQRGPAT